MQVPTLWGLDRGAAASHLSWPTRTSKQRPVSQRLTFIHPCLAVRGKVPPKGDQWVHEAKWDGYRIQIVKDGSDVRLYSKSGTEWTKRLPSIAGAFAKLPAHSTILDGELCFCDERGGPNFRALHHAMRKTKPAPERLVVFAFDLMHLAGADLRAKPLHERRRRMVDLVTEKPIPCMFIGDHFANGAALLAHCEGFGLEGVVSKRRDAPYVSGECKAWVKSKCDAWKKENKDRGRLFQEAQLRDTTTGRERR